MRLHIQKLIVLVIFMVPIILLIRATPYVANDITLLGKFSNIIPELFTTEFEHNASKAHAWRAYENIVGITHFLQFETIEIFTGRGLGYAIPIEFFCLAENMCLEVLNLLHNFFLTILIKTGVLGLSVYLTIIASLIFTKLPSDISLSSLRSGVIFCIVIVSAVTMGLFNPNSLNLLFMLWAIILTCGKDSYDQK